MKSLALLACIFHASAFVSQPASFSVKTANLIPTVANTRLSAISIPADDKEKKKKGNNSDWTETKGGFIPNLPLRKKPAQEILIQTVDNIHDYKTTVVDEKDKIVVVRFFANWCKSCKASEPYFKKLARKYHSEVKFVQVPLTKETAYLQEGLGVPSVPYGHIYHPTAGLVEEVKVSKPHFKTFKESLESYVRGSCDLPSDTPDELGEFE